MALFANKVDRSFRHFCRTGDPDALATVFDATAGRLLRVALWLVRNRADAEDLVQRTFVQAIALRGRFEAGGRVEPWLLGILGHQAQKVQRERARALPRTVRADDVVDPTVESAARELQDAVRGAQQAMVPQYRDVLTLHLEQGLDAHEIAERLDRPSGTVRTQLVRALEQLRRRLPDGFAPAAALWQHAGGGLGATLGLPGMRTAVLQHAHSAFGAAPLLAAVVPAGGSLGKAPVLAIVALVLAAIGTFCLLPDGTALLATEPRTAMAGAAVEGNAAVDDRDGDAATAAAATTAAAAAARTSVELLDPGFGALHVQVTWQDDGSPAAKVGVTLLDPIAYSPARQRRTTTDDHGRADFAHVALQRYRVVCSHDGDTEVDLAEDRVAEVQLVARRTGIARGRVVDPEGNPVADAVVCSSSDHCRDEGFPATRSDDRGNFAVPVLGFHALCARKAGFEPSLLVAAQASKLDEFLELRLRSVGGNVRGRVVDTAGRPVRRARVLIGRTEGCISHLGEEPRGEELLADDDGRFVGNGVGSQPTEVRVLAPGFAPFFERVQVTAGEVRELAIVLHGAARVHGTASGADGAVLANVVVSFGEVGDRGFGRLVTRSDADGRFALGDLPAGAVRLCAALDPDEDKQDAATHVRCDGNLTLVVDVDTEWNPVLGKGAVIRGSVAWADGGPAVAVRVGFVEPPYVEPLRWTATDATGAFELVNTGTELRDVCLRDAHGLAHVARKVAPGTLDLVVRLDADERPSATLRGRVVDAQGQPLLATLDAEGLRDQGGGARVVPRTDANGTFSLLLRPDVYSLRIATEAHGTCVVDAIALRADATNDLGAVTLQAPGSATIRVLDAIDGTHLQLLRDGLAVEDAVLARGIAAFAALQPGRYRVALTDGRAVEDEIEVRAGELLDRVLTPSLGVPVDVHITEPSAHRSPLALRVLRADGAVVAVQRLRAESAATSLRLHRGDYRIAVHAVDGRTAERAFTVDGVAAGMELELALPAR